MQKDEVAIETVKYTRENVFIQKTFVSWVQEIQMVHMVTSPVGVGGMRGLVHLRSITRKGKNFKHALLNRKVISNYSRINNRNQEMKGQAKTSKSDKCQVGGTTAITGAVV